MQQNPICFGTSGHRGIIGKDFTGKHVAAITLAIADYLKSQTVKPKIVLGYDPRKGNSPDLVPGSFTKIICQLLVNSGVEVLFFDDFTPTPVVSWYIKQHKLDGGIILTASHNPPEYNGIKFNANNGEPASSTITKIIETKANEYFGQNLDITDKPCEVEKINCVEAFSQNLIENTINLIKIKQPDFSGVSLVIDAKYGTVAATWKVLLAKLGLTNYEILNSEPLADFGKIEANPTKIKSLINVVDKIKELNSPFAIANDPDGDRHVILDENGNFITPEDVTVIIFDYLISKGIKISYLISTIASSAILKSAAVFNKAEYIETAVGFKNFAPDLLKAQQQDKLALAVESSGGFTASFHVLEKCGFLPGIFLLFILKDTQKKLSELHENIKKKYGQFYFGEEEYHFVPEKKPELVNLFKNLEPADLMRIYDLTVENIIKIDGLKVVLNDGWFLMRLSGTEPLARIYAETQSLENTQNLLKTAQKVLG